MNLIRTAQKSISEKKKTPYEKEHDSYQRKKKDPEKIGIFSHKKRDETGRYTSQDTIFELFSENRDLLRKAPSPPAIIPSRLS